MREGLGGAVRNQGLPVGYGSATRVGEAMAAWVGLTALLNLWVGL